MRVGRRQLAKEGIDPGRPGTSARACSSSSRSGRAPGIVLVLRRLLASLGRRRRRHRRRSLPPLTPPPLPGLRRTFERLLRRDHGRGGRAVLPPLALGLENHLVALLHVVAGIFLEGFQVVLLNFGPNMIELCLGARGSAAHEPAAQPLGEKRRRMRRARRIIETRTAGGTLLAARVDAERREPRHGRGSSRPPQIKFGFRFRQF